MPLETLKNQKKSLQILHFLPYEEVNKYETNTKETLHKYSINTKSILNTTINKARKKKCERPPPIGRCLQKKSRAFPPLDVGYKIVWK